MAQFSPFFKSSEKIMNVDSQSSRHKFGSMCLLCACLGFFSTKFFPLRSRQKLDNFFSWIIFLWHSSTPGRKMMWGHGLAGTQTKHAKPNCMWSLSHSWDPEFSQPLNLSWISGNASWMPWGRLLSRVSREGWRWSDVNKYVSCTHSWKWDSMPETKVKWACLCDF